MNLTGKCHAVGFNSGDGAQIQEFIFIGAQRVEVEFGGQKSKHALIAVTGGQVELSQFLNLAG